jgi:hypothetical protein
MKDMRRFALVGVVAALFLVPMGSSPSIAQSRAHVYLLRGLMNIFSLGMDDLAEKIQRRGVHATVHNHSEWQTLADSAAAAYRAGREGPIILIGHSLGADAVMIMAQYLDKKGIPLALVVPFDGTQSFATPKNVQRLVNITQRDYAYMKRGPGFRGTLSNLDVSRDTSIGHISIDKSPRLHAQVVGYVLSAVGTGHRIAVPRRAPAAKTTAGHAPADSTATKPEPAVNGAAKPATGPADVAKPSGNGNGVFNGGEKTKSLADSGTPVIAAPEKSAQSSAPATVRGSAKVTRPAISFPD